LAAVLDQLRGAEAEPQGAEAAAGVDRRQLPVIAHQHDLGLGLFGVLEQPCQLAAAIMPASSTTSTVRSLRVSWPRSKSASSRSQVATSSNPFPCKLVVAMPVGAAARSR
jgi:hypothetical protein